MRVKVNRLFVQRMMTKWGSYTPESVFTRLNTDLAKKPPECLEYILAHKLIHLLDPTHNERFVALMDMYLPHWQRLRKRLNDLPVRHVNWVYCGHPSSVACRCFHSRPSYPKFACLTNLEKLGRPTM